MQPKKASVKVYSEVTPEEAERLNEALKKIEGFEFSVFAQVMVTTS